MGQPIGFQGVPAMQTTDPFQMGAFSMAMNGTGATPQMTNDAVTAATQGNGALGGLAAPQVAGATGPDAAGGPLATKFLGMNLDSAKLALGGLQTLGNLFMGMKALKMAKDQFNYQKGVTETNLVNSIQSYNTSLADRANNRADAMNASQASADAYVNANKAVRV